MKTIDLHIEGMTCGGCVRNATNRLKSVPGVSEVAIDLATGSAKVTGSDEITGEMLSKSINGVTPYTASVL